MSAKNADYAESLVFVAEKQGYLAKLLALAGLESKHDQMKVSWVCTAIGAGLVMAIISYFIMPELAIVGFIIGCPMGAGGFVAYLEANC